VGRWFSCVWLLSVLVCLPVQAADDSRHFPLLVHNDLMLFAPGAPLGQSAGEQAVIVGTVVQPEVRVESNAGSAGQAGTAAQSGALTGNPPQVEFPVAPPAATRLVLLLPTRSPSLRHAAEAVLKGFTEAAERDKDARLNVSVIETGDDADDVLSAYQAAEAQADIIVGPLTRSGVAVIAQRAKVNKPTVALAHVEPGADSDIRLPAKMLAIGLSLEQEARQLAQQAFEQGLVGRAYIVASGAAWQRRAANAFAAQWRQLRQTSDNINIASSGQWLDIKGLQALKRRLESEEPALIFVALDAQQAGQVREATGGQVPMLGTSQLNPLPAGDWPDANRRPELDGVQLVDMPWVLQDDHPAVMAYRSGPAPSRRSVDLERLLALGIDAWRVARELTAGKSSFDIDGVTGRLKIDVNADQNRFERIASPGVYRDGVVVVAERP
jgi:outer membrane PBP1 activator LpoA protein